MEVESVCDTIWQSNSEEDCRAGVKLLRKIVKNILSHPDEEKYQRLPLSKVAGKLNKCFGAVEFLLCAGTSFATSV